MVKIHERFIHEAQNIRNKYLNEIKNLNSKEDKINIYKEQITEVMKEILKYVEKTERATEEEISVDLKNELGVLDINMKRIQKEVKILIDNIEILEKRSKKLYDEIREKYPELSAKDIQKEILYSLKE